MLGPLGLPRGSVRALLAMSVVFVTCWLTVRGEATPLAVSEALFTALAYYFASRARFKLTPSEREVLRAHRGGEHPHPLFLPKGTIRVVIIASFVGLVVYVLHQSGWQGLAEATTLILVLAFFAGQVLKHVVKWLRPKHARGKAATLEHVKAAFGMAIGAAFVGFYVTGFYRSASPQAHKVFLGLIIFYFGSR